MMPDSEPETNDLPRYYSSLLFQLVRTDRKVTLEPHENTGVDIRVDGVSVLPGPAGFPTETFEMSSGWEAEFDDEQLALLNEVLSENDN